MSQLTDFPMSSALLQLNDFFKDQGLGKLPMFAILGDRLGPELLSMESAGNLVSAGSLVSAGCLVFAGTSDLFLDTEILALLDGRLQTLASVCDVFLPARQLSVSSAVVEISQEVLSGVWESHGPFWSAVKLCDDCSTLECD